MRKIISESGIRNIKELSDRYKKAKIYFHMDLDGVTTAIAMKKYLEDNGIKVVDYSSGDDGYGFRGEIDKNALKTELTKTPGFQVIFYLSTPAAAFGEISNMLKKCNLVDARSKVVLEKPLGFSLASSKEIHAKINQCFTENQI